MDKVGIDNNYLYPSLSPFFLNFEDTLTLFALLSEHIYKSSTYIKLTPYDTCEWIIFLSIQNILSRAFKTTGDTCYLDHDHHN